MEKEQIKKDIKDLKSKMEGMMKNMITLNDNSVKLCNKYTDNKQEEFRKSLTNTENMLNQKSLDMRTMIVQFQNDLNQKVINLKTEFDKIINMKDYLIQIINEKYEYFGKLNDEVNKKTMRNKDKLETHQKKLEDKDEEISNIKQDIKDLTFQIRNYYCVSNKLTILLEELRNNPYRNNFNHLLSSAKNKNKNNNNNNNNNNEINKNEINKNEKNKNETNKNETVQ